MITLFPTVNLDQIVSIVQERRVYLPSFGFCLNRAARAARFASPPVRGRAIRIAMAALTLTYVAFVWRTQRIPVYWHNHVTLLSRAVPLPPDAVSYRMFLDPVFAERRDLPDPGWELRRATELQSNSLILHDALGQTYAKGRHVDVKREFHIYLVAFRSVSDPELTRVGAPNPKEANQPSNPGNSDSQTLESAFRNAADKCIDDLRRINRQYARLSSAQKIHLGLTQDQRAKILGPCAKKLHSEACVIAESDYAKKVDSVFGTSLAASLLLDCKEELKARDAMYRAQRKPMKAPSLK